LHGEESASARKDEGSKKQHKQRNEHRKYIEKTILPMSFVINNIIVSSAQTADGCLSLESFTSLFGQATLYLSKSPFPLNEGAKSEKAVNHDQSMNR